MSESIQATLPSPSIPIALDGGLGYDEIARDPQARVLVQVGPWNDFKDGDTLQILWGANEDVLATYSANESDANTTVNLFVAAFAIQAIGNGTHDVKARVINKLGGPITSFPASILVKLSVPGGHDPDAHTPYANENLAAAVVVPPSIDPATTGATVTIAPYENMAEGDLVTVRWNVEGNDVSYGPVSKDEADNQRPLTVSIDRATIDKGGPGDPVNITYEVYDVVRNWSLWSPYATVTVDDPNAPQAPWVEGTVNDGGKVLDVDQLAGDALSVLVENSKALVGDEVTVHWAGVTGAGLPLAHDTEPQVPVRVGQTLFFSIPNDKVRPLAQGTAHAWYTIDPVAGPPQRASAKRNLEVTGQAVRLLAPTVAEAKGDVLYPEDISPTGANATVPAWTGMQAGDRVELWVEGKRFNGDPTQWSKSEDIASDMLGLDVAFKVPLDQVIPLVDGSMRVYYLVRPIGSTRQGRTGQRAVSAVLRSDPLDLQVRDASSLPLLEAPTMPELENGVLDPDTHPAPKFNIPAYTGIAVNDRIDIALRGGAVPHDSFIPVSSPTTPPVFTIPANVITANRHQTLTGTYTVSRAGSGVGLSRPLVFRIDSVAAELPAPGVDEATGSNLDPVNAVDGITVRIPPTAGISAADDVTVTLTGTASGSGTTPPKDGSPDGMVFTLGAVLIAHDLGTRIVIHYTVTPKGGGTSRISAELPLDVLDFQANDPGVSKPAFVEALGAFVLDLATFTGDATVSVARWPLMASGQRFWMSAVAGANRWPIAVGEPVTSVGTLTRPLARAWLDALADNTSITLELKIAFGGGDETSAKVFTSQPYSLRAAATTFPAPSVPEATGGTLAWDVPFATLRVPATAGLQTGELVTGYFAGNSLGSKTATAGVPLDFNIPSATIVAQQGNAIACHYTVRRANADLPSANLALTVTAKPNEWDLEYDFDQDRLRYITPTGGSLYFPEAHGTMDFQFDPDTVHVSTERLGVERYPFAATVDFSGNDIYIGYPSGTTNKNVVFINFDQSWDVARFAVTSANREVTVSFKDAGLNVIGNIVTIPPGAEERQTEVKYDDQGRGRIRHVEIRSLEVIRLDSFKFRSTR